MLVDATDQDHSDMREALVSLTDVRQTGVVEQYLLQNERSDRLRQLRALLHDAQTQRNDLRRQQKLNHLLFVRLQSTLY